MDLFGQSNHMIVRLFNLYIQTFSVCEVVSLELDVLVDVLFDGRNNEELLGD